MISVDARLTRSTLRAPLFNYGDRARPEPCMRPTVATAPGLISLRDCRLRWIATTVKPTSSDKFIRPAKRPKYSVLSSASLERHGITMPTLAGACGVTCKNAANLKRLKPGSSIPSQIYLSRSPCNPNSPSARLLQLLVKCGKILAPNLFPALDLFAQGAVDLGKGCNGLRGGRGVG